MYAKILNFFPYFSNYFKNNDFLVDLFFIKVNLLPFLFFTDLIISKKKEIMINLINH